MGIIVNAIRRSYGKDIRKEDEKITLEPERYDIFGIDDRIFREIEDVVIKHWNRKIYFSRHISNLIRLNWNKDGFKQGTFMMSDNIYHLGLLMNVEVYMDCNLDKYEIRIE